MTGDGEEAWAARVLSELVPMIAESYATVSLVPRGATDVKFAVELGLSIMLDKPVILVVGPGVQVPAKLAKVADGIVEGDSSTEAGRAAIRGAVHREVSRILPPEVTP